MSSLRVMKHFLKCYETTSTYRSTADNKQKIKSYTVQKNDTISFWNEKLQATQAALCKVITC